MSNLQEWSTDALMHYQTLWSLKQLNGALSLCESGIKNEVHWDNSRRGASASRYILNVTQRLVRCEEVVGTVEDHFAWRYHSRRVAVVYGGLYRTKCMDRRLRQKAERRLYTGVDATGRARGRYSRKFLIGVCREGSQTLTLFKDEANENWYPI